MRTFRLVLVVGLLVPLLAVTPALARPKAGPSATVPDPAAAGPLTPVRVEYDAGPTLVDDPKGISYPAELAGVLWYPEKGSGPFPVLLLLHGNHGTCDPAPAFPCPTTPATAPIPSYAGYDYLASNLASHGYVVASVDANGVNTYNQAGDKGAHERAELLARTLDLLSSWNEGPGPDPVGDALVGRIDITRIGMMGHSRGGEGVTTFVDYNATRTDGPRYPVLAVFALAGTDYNLPSGHGTNFANLLPLCDGDVYDLQSSFAWDRGHVDAIQEPYARVQFTVQGTNHNYFNTVWTSDDFSGRPSDSACSPSSPTTDRLSPEGQRRVGLVLIAAFLRRYAGGEAALDPLITGAAPLPASICPGGTGSCPGLVGRSYLAPASERRYIVSPLHTGRTLTETAEHGALSATGFSTFSYCDPHADNGTDGNNRDPGTNSGCPTNPNRTRVRQLTLAWDGPAVLRAGLVDGDVGSFQTLVFRTAVNFSDERNVSGTAQDVDVTLVDGHGRRATVAASRFSNALVPPPGSAARSLTLNGVRIPLSAFPKVHLDDIAGIELGFGNRTPSGSVQLAQLAFQHE